MAIEDPVEEDELEKKVDDLSEKAKAQITVALVENGTVPEAADAEQEADLIFESLHSEATKLYFEVTDSVHELSSPTERFEVIRELLANMTKCFTRDGYVHEATAKRLTAAMAQLFEDYED